MAEQWQQLCEDPFFQDVPYKIETSESGQIVMSPATNHHGDLQTEIAVQLRLLLPQGRSQVEASIATTDGVKVPDVIWKDSAFIKKYGRQVPFPEAPSICVEVLSPSNRGSEITRRIALYLARGAVEVWICREDGVMAFHGHAGLLKHSQLCPKFPVKV